MPGLVDSIAIVINGAAGVGPKAWAFPSWILHVQFDGLARVFQKRGLWLTPCGCTCYKRHYKGHLNTEHPKECEDPEYKSPYQKIENK
jgi:hypothetical protein